MKTDRELLELAARAAGIEGYIHEWVNGPEFIIPGENPATWNPLQDDGNALRLSMKLKIRVLHPTVEAPDAVRAGSFKYGFVQEDYADHGGDYMAATRFAITRAAAQIQLDKEKT
jgi:hypothetical protein